jgi:hypothetical protein
MQDVAATWLQVVPANVKDTFVHHFLQRYGSNQLAGWQRVSQQL